MTSLALALVLSSALAHATWNLLAKHVEGGATFIWLFDGISVAIYTPVAAAVALTHGLPLELLALLLVLASASLHLGYFLLLTRGYRAGDLSLVYPLARGTGPLLATVAAIILLGERPAPIALVGTLLIVGGAVLLTGDPRRLLRAGAGPAAGYALLTGGFIAGYTLVDKLAVGPVAVNPILYTWGLFVVNWSALTPNAVRKRSEVAVLWRQHGREAVGIGVLSPLAYILVLAALSFSPVSYVAPVREIGILFGAIMGAQLLRERDPVQRLSAAMAMVVGVGLLALH